MINYAKYAKPLKEAGVPEETAAAQVYAMHLMLADAHRDISGLCWQLQRHAQRERNMAQLMYASAFANIVLGVGLLLSFFTSIKW